MSLSIAEYIGQRTDVENPKILPFEADENIICPFMNSRCTKIVTKNKPVCSVRNTDGNIWIVCRERLCSTRNKIDLSEHQKSILLQVAEMIFYKGVEPVNVLIRREVPIPVVKKSTYHADYVMVLDNDKNLEGPKKVVLEMQGGGETSNTQIISGVVTDWEKKPSNEFLRQPISKVGPIVTNAWRRQQEQFLVKGNVAQQSNAGIVFCVGNLLYDYLWSRVEKAKLRDLSKHSWTMALICFDEVKCDRAKPGPIPLKINENKAFFTNYNSFLQVLTNQGDPCPDMFKGDFVDLDGNSRIID